MAEQKKKHVIPDLPMAAESAYALIQQEIGMDSEPQQNLATFSNSVVDEWGHRLVEENLSKNFINRGDYQYSNVVEKRLIWMIGELMGTEFLPGDESDPDHCPRFYGTTTNGSSEAVMLGLIAHRHRWRLNNQGNPLRHPQDRPFVLMSTHVHTCWDKYCKYFEVGALYVPVGNDQFSLTGSVVQHILEQSIAESPFRDQILAFCAYPSEYEGWKKRKVGELVMVVGCIAGSNYTGNNDDIKGIDEAIDAYVANTGGAPIPIHLDAASSGLIIPFLETDEEALNPIGFRGYKHIQSINISNHKFGFTYPGLGCVLFRNHRIVASELVYQISYLSGTFANFGINFTRSSSMILLQYYQFLRLGKTGYRQLIQHCLGNAQLLVRKIIGHPQLGQFLEPISDNTQYPICVFKWVGADPESSLPLFIQSLADQDLRIPYYRLPTTSPLSPDGHYVIRMVVQQHLTTEFIHGLILKMDRALQGLAVRPSSL
ncbi:MAG: pyridoxal-dependent decarboxylase [Bacteroidota bacterium]